MTLDEIQRVPELLRSIKVAVDRDRKPGAFILTGSANLLLLPRASESLAGRIEILQLYPLCEAEKERAPGAFLKTLLDGGLEPRILPAKESDPLSLARRLVAGGYPEALQRLPNRVSDWHRQYLRTIMERDVPVVAQIRDASRLRTLLEKLALQSSGLSLALPPPELCDHGSRGGSTWIDRNAIELRAHDVRGLGRAFPQSAEEASGGNLPRGQGSHAGQEGGIYHGVFQRSHENGWSASGQAETAWSFRTGSEDPLPQGTAWYRRQVRSEHHDGCVS